VFYTLRAALIGFAGWAVLGALPGATILAMGLRGVGGARWAAVIAGLLLVAIGVLSGVAVGLFRALGRQVPANKYGLCSGMPGVLSRKAQALTPWLYDVLQSLSGFDADARPLTFKDLKMAGVELRMMTTNLTRRQPMAMPWTERQYFFDPVEFRELFPDKVVEWMEHHPPEPVGNRSDRWAWELLLRQAGGVRPLPAPDDLPVIVATRMSLSFPLLISAVPLYSVDYYTSPANSVAKAAADEWYAEHPGGTVEEAFKAIPRRTFDINWFSDGGICSNFPLHFFDRPLPTRPTFAIDLAQFTLSHPQSSVESDNSYLPEANWEGLLRPWTCWKAGGLGALAGFGRSIVDTARCWVDESQLGMPGYRDRVVTIFLDNKKEGGMNLTMPNTLITALAERGRGGATKLVKRFAGDMPGVVPTRGWDNQRWIRFRTATAGLERWLTRFRNGYFHQHSGQTPYADLAGPGAATPLPSYKFTGHRREAVNQRTGELLNFAAEWDASPFDCFVHGAPSPRPQLRLVPHDQAQDEPSQPNVHPAVNAPADKAHS
jgi:predicted acylesterase/phospholipase RssA